MERLCSMCRLSFDESEFTKKKNGYNSYCRNCQRIYQREYMRYYRTLQKHKDYEREYNKEYVKRRKEK